MKKLYPYLLLALLLFTYTQSKAQVNKNDSLALVNLYNNTNGPHWYRAANWLTKSPVSTWYGVTVTANRVTSLILSINVVGNSVGNNLMGSIPDSIGYLTSLTELVININQLSGSIPSSMGNLINLKNLDISSNQLSGDVPASFSNLTKLYYLNLNYNQLTGNLSFLAKLRNLNDIELSTNQFSSKIPRLNNLNLSVLNLDGNQLSGSIPTFGKDTASIISINLVHNKLTGNINHQLDSLSNLYELFLEYNQLSGKIPASLNKFGKLHEIVLDQNQFTGKLPALDSLRNLDLFSVAYNKLSGNIPASFNKNTKLYFLELSNNNLSGRVPSLDSLDLNANIYLQNNQLTFAGMEGIARHFPSTYYTIYSPQANISINQNGNLLSVDAGGTISNNTYKWYRNGKLYRTKTGNATLTASNDGAYTVEVTNSVATQLTLKSDTVNYAAFHNIVTSATSNILKSAYIFPNPATTTANVYFTTTKKYTVTVTDASGNLLQTIAIQEGSHSTSLDVSKYAKGIYFVSLIDNNKHTQTLKLIKE